MSGMAIAAAAGNTPVITSVAGTSLGSNPAGVNSQGRITLNTDGSITYGGVVEGSGGPAFWIGSGALPGIGALWWVKWALISGTMTSSTTAAGSWAQLNVVQVYTKGPATTSVASVGFTLEFSSDGGATTSKTVTGWSCGYDHS